MQIEMPIEAMSSNSGVYEVLLTNRDNSQLASYNSMELKELSLQWLNELKNKIEKNTLAKEKQATKYNSYLQSIDKISKIINEDKLIWTQEDEDQLIECCKNKEEMDSERKTMFKRKVSKMVRKEFKIEIEEKQTCFSKLPKMVNSMKDSTYMAFSGISTFLLCCCFFILFNFYTYLYAYMNTCIPQYHDNLAIYCNYSPCYRDNANSSNCLEYLAKKAKDISSTIQQQHWIYNVLQFPIEIIKDQIKNVRITT